MEMLTQRRMLDSEKRVLSLIPVGSENCIMIRDIKAMTGIGSRSIKRIIHSLVTEFGVVILAVRTGKIRGYYIPESEMERAFGLGAFKSQIIREMERMSVIENAPLDSYKKYLEEENVDDK